MSLMLMEIRPRGLQLPPTGLHSADHDIGGWDVFTSEAGQAGLQAFLENLAGLSLVPIGDQVADVDGSFINGADFEELAGELDLIGRAGRGFDDFETILPAQVAVTFAADILTGRNIGQVDLELALLFEDPGGAVLEAGIDFFLRSAFGRFDGDG